MRLYCDNLGFNFDAGKLLLNITYRLLIFLMFLDILKKGISQVLPFLIDFVIELFVLWIFYSILEGTFKSLLFLEQVLNSRIIVY